MRLPFLRRPPSAAPTSRKITLYTKPGCHLCEDALHMLERCRERWPLEIEQIDISRDPVLMSRYGIRIPVVVIDGRKEIDAPITERALRKALG